MNRSHVDERIDETHDPGLRSWVDSANGQHDFPIQNLPFGIFDAGDAWRRGGIAIGDEILDLAALARSGVLSGEALQAAQTASESTLNALMALGRTPARALRRAVSALLAGRTDGATRERVAGLLHPAANCRMHLPAQIGDYTDFYAGIHHASNVGALFRPDAPLLPNYKYVPIAYHGRASSIRLSGAEVHRPRGQLKPPGAHTPSLVPSRQVDYELELAAWIGAGNELGEPIALADAPSHLFGVGLLNDWSARDIQAWEYQPLGPFLAKNFLTSVAPWIITADALVPFRTAQRPRPEGDPAPLPYLSDPGDQRRGALGIELEVALQTQAMRAKHMAPHRLARISATALYWSIGQMIAHHTVGGCNLRPGDLLGTGTISDAAGAVGSLLELSSGGQTSIALPDGTTRTFLEDGDEVSMTAHARAEGYVSIGFGECRGRILGQ
jgi:fumarylacetoacetase